MTNGRLQILIVEDEIISALFLTEYIKMLGHDCFAPVTRGRDAVIQAKIEKPDIIFMDIKLEDDIDGIEAAKQILTCQQIPIVFMSAYSDNEIVDSAKKLKPMAYFQKPIETENIREMIELTVQKSGGLPRAQ
ncbi:MAG TPA: response regulator [Candidatus Wallbacteria bacterium]|nr:response regulator [Candidatus Wallbacteria bacterium]